MLCERCQAAERVKGERFCKTCKKRVKQELLDAGYLQKVHGGPRGRGDGAAEDKMETKKGGSPSFENVVRAIEDC